MSNQSAKAWLTGSCISNRFHARGLLITLMMETARTSEMLVSFFQTTLRYNPLDSHLISTTDPITRSTVRCICNISTHSATTGEHGSRPPRAPRGVFITSEVASSFIFFPPWTHLRFSAQDCCHNIWSTSKKRKLLIPVAADKLDVTKSPEQSIN
jgi:hypothetical protein